LLNIGGAAHNCKHSQEAWRAKRILAESAGSSERAVVEYIEGQQTVNIVELATRMTDAALLAKIFPQIDLVFSRFKLMSAR
jgi:hypothetical protein